MEAVEVVRHRHDDPPFGIDVPAAAERYPAPGVLLVAREPEGVTPAPFRTNLTVIAEEVEPGADTAAYADASLTAQAPLLPGWRLIDREDGVPVGEHRAVRTLATYLASAVEGIDLGGDLSVTVEQWRFVHDGLAWVVSASCETNAYALVFETWTECALSLRPGERA